MEEESGAISKLGEFALGNLLQEIGIESEAGMDRLGLGPRGATATAALDRDQIYNERYEDDDDEELRDMGRESLAEQAEADRRQAEQKAMQDRYFAKGLASMGGSRANVRGETDDFDDDEDDEEDEDERALPARQASPDSPPAQYASIKTEPLEDDGDFMMSSTTTDRFSHTANDQQPTASTSAIPTPPSLGLPTPPPMRDPRDFWPDFHPDKVLDFTDFFAAPRRKKRRVQPSRPVKLRPSSNGLQEPASTQDLALQPLVGRHKEQAYVYRVAGDLIDEEKRRAKAAFAEPKLDLEYFMPSSLKVLELDDWESRILMNPGQQSHRPEPPPVDVERPRNRALDDDAWLRAVIWSDEQAKDPVKMELNSRLVLDLNDEEMMLEEVDPSAEDQRTSSLLTSAAPLMSRRAAQVAATLDPLNMSNDGFYELSREQRQRIQRQTLGALVVQHTKVARKLQLPFYKTRLTKTEARSFHRPAMQFPINIPLSFSRLERAAGAVKGKKDKRKNKDADEVLRSTRDLTLKEQGGFVLYEYSEEHPPIPSKIGMGSILVNYYRKEDAKDEYIPKLDLGEPFILEPNDESPFLKFGSVEPGQTQSTLYNNLVRAPIFRHEPATTDFLLVRVTSKNSVKYYLRDIKNLFVVGQNYPLAVIPGPHARLVTNAIRNRLIMIARKLVEQSKGNRIKIHRIMKYFPDQSELQMRQRLKEFMEYARRAGDPNQGFWRLRSNVSLPNDAELEKILPPEHLCLAEAMQAGQRHLLDAGYARTAEGADEDEDKDTGLDIEQLLAPWTTSKNFIMATQGKAMLRLHGDGDPTGRGEGFSFVRVSMKDVFHKAGESLESRLAQQAEEERRSGHKYNVARQQQLYREEIDRIWEAQKSSLSDVNPPELTYAEANPEPTPEPEEEDEEEDEEEERNENGTKPNQDGEAIAKGKVLRIRRQIQGRWQTEIVRDHKIIQSYTAARQRIADEATSTDALLPTGDSALDAARRKRLEEEIASRRKNQERRLARRNAKAVKEGRALPGEYRKLMSDKPTTSRKCGRCGAIGHMSSNRSCPLWNQAPSTAASGGQSSVSGAATANAMAGGPGTPMGGMPGGLGRPNAFFGGAQQPPSAGPPSGLHTRGPSFSGPSGSMGSPAGGMMGGASSPAAAAASSPSAAGSGGGSGKIKLKIKRAG